jgi:Flp pilus assembly protein TadB
MDMRVFWSVLAALIVFGVAVVGWRALERQRDIEDANAALQSISTYATQAMQDGQRAELQRRQQQQQQVASDWRRRELAGNQRCVGGVVVVVDGATYTQLGTVGDPVRCQGHYVDRPIR